MIFVRRSSCQQSQRVKLSSAHTARHNCNTIDAHERYTSNVLYTKLFNEHHFGLRELKTPLLTTTQMCLRANAKTAQTHARANDVQMITTNILSFLFNLTR